MAQIPSLLQRADEINNISSPVEALIERLVLVDRCWAIDDQLKAWYQEAHPDSAPPQYWPVLATLANPADDTPPDAGRVFPTVFRFPSIRLAMRYLQYWSTLILLYSTISMTYRFLRADRSDQSRPQHPADRQCQACSQIPGSTICICGHEANTDVPFDTSILRPAPDASEFYEIATNVARSVEYCIGAEMGNFGAIVIIFPLRVATQFFRHRSRLQRFNVSAGSGVDETSSLRGFGKFEIGSGSGQGHKIVPLDTDIDRSLRWCEATLETISDTKNLPFSRQIGQAKWGYRGFRSIPTTTITTTSSETKTAPTTPTTTAAAAAAAAATTTSYFNPVDLVL